MNEVISHYWSGSQAFGLWEKAYTSDGRQLVCYSENDGDIGVRLGDMLFQNWIII